MRVWQEAASVRRFAAAVEEGHALGELADQSSDDLMQSLAWAREYAEAIDSCNLQASGDWTPERCATQ